MTFAVLEFVIGQFAGILALDDRQDAAAVVRVDACQPGFGRRIDHLGGIDATHHPPHARIEGGLGVEVVVPNPLPGALQGEVPAVFAFRQRGFGPLLLVDVDGLDDQVMQFAGFRVADGRCRDQHPDRIAGLGQIAALGAIVVGTSVFKLAHLGPRCGRIVGVNQIADAGRDVVVLAIAEQIVEGAVCVKQMAGWPDQEGGHGGVFQNSAEQCFAVPELERIALGNRLSHFHRDQISPNFVKTALL